MTSNLDLRESVMRILLNHQGRSKAIKGSEFARLLGFHDDRQVRQVIRELIADGYPIASSTEKPAGFFITVCRSEVEAYAKTLRKRLIEDAIRRRDFLRASRVILQPEQLKFMIER